MLYCERKSRLSRLSSKSIEGARLSSDSIFAAYESGSTSTYKVETAGFTIAETVEKYLIKCETFSVQFHSVLRTHHLETNFGGDFVCPNTM